MFPKIAPRLRVHAGGRLVEQQKFRLMDEARREREALLPSAGKLPGELLLAACEAEAFDALLHGLRAIFHGVHARDKIQVFPDAQILPKAEPLRHVADVLLDFLALADHVEAEACAAARIRAQEAAEHADEGRLAAAVWPEESEDLAGADLQRDVVHDGRGTEALRHSAHVDREILSHNLRCKFNIHRLAGMQLHRRRRVES